MHGWIIASVGVEWVSMVTDLWVWGMNWNSACRRGTGMDNGHARNSGGGNCMLVSMQ